MYSTVPIVVCTGFSAILALIGTFLQVQLRMSGALIGIALLWAQIVGVFGYVRCRLFVCRFVCSCDWVLCIDRAIALYKLGEKWSIKGAMLISMLLFTITPILAFLVGVSAILPLSGSISNFDVRPICLFGAVPSRSVRSVLLLSGGDSGYDHCMQYCRIRRFDY